MTIRVNGVEIGEEAVNVESGNYTGGSIPERQHQAAVALVVRELLRQRADALGIPRPDTAGEAGTAEDECLDAVIDREVSIPEADEAACREYFEKNRERFRTEDLVEARHILLAAMPDDFDERDRRREEAETLIEELRVRPDSFPHLARERSACPSREQGGALGQLSRGQTVPEFEAVVLRLPEGLAERPVETRYGWHVVEIVRRVDGARLPFEAVRERIAEYLTERSRRRAFSQYVRMLAADAEIEGIEIEGADSPLIQ